MQIEITLFYLVLAQSTSLSVSYSPIQTSLRYLLHMFYIGTLFPDTTAEVATVTENLYDDGTIPAYLVSISFEPITGTSGEEENGILTWGLCNYHLKLQP